MYTSTEKTFRDTFVALKIAMLSRGVAVRTERWQGVQANLDTRELRNVNFEIDLGGIEDLNHWRQDIRPNLSWADGHFLERVGGVCLNPGEEWKRWPWGQSANKFRGTDELGPRFPPQDWAYLAGMIDGEGTIYFQRHKLPSFQGVIRIYQKNRFVLDYLHSLFRVGDVHEVGGQQQVLNGTEYNDASHQWAIGAILEIRWILSGVLPYLKVKQDVAKSTLMAINSCLQSKKETGVPMKKVWGQDWPARFNHTYADRLWPKRLEGGNEFRGQHWTYGDLNNLVDLLAKEPYTRQAWIPLFHPEDTGLGDGGRKMCSLGYQVIVRDGRAHIWYPLRSVDLVRHFSDDCYLAVRMLLWIIDRCRERSEVWCSITPGSYAMHCTSLHVFETDLKEITDDDVR
jgi:hypothetical protein